MFPDSRLLQRFPSGRTWLPRQLSGPLVLAATLGVVLGVGSLTAAGSAQLTGDDVRGKALYVAHCATCHGNLGRGDGPGAATMMRGFGRVPRNLTDNAYMSRKSDAQLTEIIKWSGGQGKHGSLLPMPQWGLTLKDQDIADVLAYVRVLHNPPRIKGDPASGKKLFAQYCSACHGLTGQGNGPLARSSLGLKVKPRSFTDKAMMSRLTERDIYNAIKQGGPAVGRSAWMPGWGDALKEQELGDLVAYIRALASPKTKSSK